MQEANNKYKKLKLDYWELESAYGDLYERLDGKFKNCPFCYGSLLRFPGSKYVIHIDAGTNCQLNDGMEVNINVLEEQLQQRCVEEFNKI